jgi:type II secretory ATPase GspE/PulE/Tfp pilus assembly ATPase PilB-like protein
MVFSTVHANDTISALYRLIDLGVEAFLMSSALSAILGQRLVRKLCDDCKEPYPPKPELLKQVGLPADKIESFYRPPTDPAVACPTCGGMGYKGRLGVFELRMISNRLRDMIRENAPVAAHEEIERMSFTDRCARPLPRR